MEHARRYAILGTGALGGFYGARLQRAGADVHFLIHTDFEHVHQHGLVVDSKDGDFALTEVQAYRDVHEMPRCDVVAVALKATQNYLLPSLLPPVLADGGVVLLMQNGLGAEEDVARIVSGHTVVAGLCFVCSNKVGPGHIRHLDYGAVCFAQYRADGAPAGVTNAMHDVARDFVAANLQVELVEDLVLARWQKLVWNVPMSGLSVVLNADTRALMADAHTRALVEDIMDEVVAGARASSGRHLDSSFVQKMLGMTLAMAPYRASMKIDFDEHRPMEVEAIYGNPVRAARNAGAAMPLVETLYRQLKFLDTRNLGLGRTPSR
ncbi:MAG: putative 2-dehydropantoate 2-reductase [Polyangia bacterium]|jgi:2-dehydropantoate 2-reductase